MVSLEAVREMGKSNTFQNGNETTGIKISRKMETKLRIQMNQKKGEFEDYYDFDDGFNGSQRRRVPCEDNWEKMDKLFDMFQIYIRSGGKGMNHIITHEQHCLLDCPWRRPDSG